MKTLNLKTIMALMLLFCSLSCLAKKTVKWENPTTLSSNVKYLNVKSVEFSDTATIVELITSHPTNIFSFLDCTNLIGDVGKQYKIKYCKEMGLNKWSPNWSRDGAVYTLVFEPMPLNTKVFDFVEGWATYSFRFLGISDSKKTLKIKPFAYNENNTKYMRKNFFKTDTACIKSVVEGYSRSQGYTSFMVCRENNLTGQDQPIVIGINEDGSFEQKIILDTPLYSRAFSDRGVSFMFFVKPGQTLNVVLHKDGTVDYSDPTGKDIECKNALKYMPSFLDYYDYTNFGSDLKNLDFVNYGKKIDTCLNKTLNKLNYFANRFNYNDNDYLLAKNNIIIEAVSRFMDYPVYKDEYNKYKYNHIDLPENHPYRQILDVANYDLLRKIPHDDSFILSIDEYGSLQNRYLYSDVLSTSHTYNMINEKGDSILAYYTVSNYDSLLVNRDKEIWGEKTPSLLMKVHILNEIYYNYGKSMFDGDDMVDTYKKYNLDADEATLQQVKEKYINEKKIEFQKLRALLHDESLEAKADEIFENYINNSGLVYELPEGEATNILRKITDKYKGKFLYIDFWSTGCGPCRYEIEQTENMRKELRDNSDVDFIFVTGADQSPDDNYNKYVAEHLQGEDSYRVSGYEFFKLMELF